MRAGPDARDLVERAFDELLLAPRAVGSDGEAVRLVAQALDEEQRRIARRKLERLAALDEEGLAPGVAVGALGDRGEPHALDAERGQHLARRLELPAPAVDDDEVGRIGKGARLRRLAVPHEAREAARQHLAHHRVIVAGRQVRALDVEGAVLVLDEAFGPGDDHRPDRVGPHDVGIVVDLDPPDRMVDAERLAQRGDELLLGRRLRRACATEPRARCAARRRPDPSSRRAAARRWRCDGRRARSAPRTGSRRSEPAWLSSTRRGAGRSR